MFFILHAIISFIYLFNMVPTGPGNREFDMGASRAGKSPAFH